MANYLLFDEATHTYTLDGVILPSVTEICKPLTVDIAEGARPWLRDAAAAKGREIHEICCEIDYQGDADGIFIPTHLAGYIQAYMSFLRDYQIKEWLAIEQPVASASLGVAGTIDRLGVIDGVLTIVDIKSGSKIDKATLWTQLYGYFLILQSHDFNCPFIPSVIQKSVGVNGVSCIGVQLQKDGSYRVYRSGPTLLFSDLLSVYHERRRINAKRANSIK